MVTDEEYRMLKKRVETLEKKLNLLSIQYSADLMKSDYSKQEYQRQEPVKKRDTTRYKFQGNVYNKRRLVLTCIKWYLTNNENLTVDELKDAFPDYIQGSLGIIKSVDEAQYYSNPNRRFYFNDEDLIIMNGKMYVVCSQWDKKNIDRFIVQAEKIGCDIERIEM